jgi:hypothetical protein
MKKIYWVLSFFLILIISGCHSLNPNEGSEGIITPLMVNPTGSAVVEGESSHNDVTETPNTTAESTPNAGLTEIPQPPTLTPTPDPLGNLFDCQMTIEFTSGPLESNSTTFSVLGEDYFTEKGDKFALGKGTGIYYEPMHYFILHSSYIRRIFDQPLEAEFIRKYLESWGPAGPQTIQGNIDALIGSEVVWTCEGGSRYVTEIDGIIRLSHEASNRLWLEPLNIPDILGDREGLVSEWVGKIEIEDDSRFLLGFCGWGPESLGEERYTYYRYLVSFNLLVVNQQ